MHPFYQNSYKRSKTISSIIPKYTRSLETSTSQPVGEFQYQPKYSSQHVGPPRVYDASSKPQIPNTAIKASLSEYLAKERSKSSYGISMLAKVICEQNFVFSVRALNKPETPRALLGRELHKEYLQTHVDKRHRDLPFTTPEEEAAHLFLYIPTALATLIRTKTRSEFPLVGHHFHRAFHGSIDKVDAVFKDGAMVLQLHEVKTTETILQETTIRIAHMQASLYVHFMKRMLDSKPHFDFEAYFTARGLHTSRPFDPKFATAFRNQQFPDMNPSRSIPINLKSLIHQWKGWIQTLPKIEFDEHVYITSLQTGKISSVLGFGAAPKVEVLPRPHNVDFALLTGQKVIDILDGRKEPSGMAEESIAFCMACEYHNKCPWKPDLHGKPVEHLVPVSTMLEEGKPQVIPASDVSAVIALPTNLVISNEYPSVRRALEQALQDARPRRNARLLAALESLRLSRMLGKARAPRQRSSVAEELEKLRKEQETATATQRKRLAKHLVARKAREHKKAEEEARKIKAKEEARKIRAIQLAAQRKAQRNLVQKRRGASRGVQSSELVPYVPPTRTTSGVTLHKPSLARNRVHRRQVQEHADRYTIVIPSGGQAVPQDETWSTEKLSASHDMDKYRTYQFDTLPSLAKRQMAMTLKEAKEAVTSLRADTNSLTDIELEDAVREERRARRRRERGADKD